MKPTVAVIGSGIAGMAVAYQLRNNCDVYLYEKNDYIGGHTNTVTLDRNGKVLPIDTGFMVYNHKTYPNLVKLFDELGVQSHETSMSFSLQDHEFDLEFACSGFNAFFAQRRNLLRIEHWKLYRDILSFFDAADSVIERSPPPDYSISDFSRDYQLNPRVLQHFILPMAGAIWSTPHEDIRSFSAHALLRFMKNHQMLSVENQLSWRTLKGGSDQYKKALLSRLPREPLTNFQPRQVHQDSEAAYLYDPNGNRLEFDYIVVAAHANQALDLLASPTAQQQELLGSFQYNKNTAILHSDASVMPNQKRAWSSWNARREVDDQGNPRSSVHYWMNSLQQLDTEENFFVSIDYAGKLDQEKIHWEATYEHPRFDSRAIAAQTRLPELNEQGRLKFCGSYFRHGFHEDALWSGLQVARQIKTEEGAFHELERV